MDIITFLMVLSLALIFFLIGILKTNYMKKKRGREGEKIVAKSLNFWVERKNKNYVYHDITLPTKSGRTTQIDHLVLSTKGIFVIETKYLNGAIHGDVENPYWTHTNHLNKKNQIYNPLMQNTGHLKHLAQLLKVPMSEMTGIVTNVGNAKLRGSIKPLFGKAAIERGTGFAFRMWWSSDKPFTQERIDCLKDIIERNRLEQDDEVNKKHIEYVKGFKSKKSNGNAVAVIGATLVIGAVFVFYLIG